MKNIFTFRHFRKIGFSILIGCTCSVLLAQNNMGIGTTIPDPSAILEVSATAKGLLIPRLSNGQQNGVSNPAYGLMIFNTDQRRFNYYDAGWKPIGVWKINASDEIYYNAANVGIGTNNPVNMLDVNGGIAVGASYAGSYSAPAHGAIIQGNVGIGTSGPASKLAVNGGLSVGGVYSYSYSAPSYGAIFQGSVGIGTHDPKSKLDVEGGLTVGAAYAGTEAAPANGAIFEGRVGIGTENPNHKLEVDGTIKVTHSLKDFYIPSWPASGGVILNGVFDGKGNGAQLRFEGVSGAGFIDIGNDASGNFVVESSDIQKFRVEQTGNVFIADKARIGSTSNYSDVWLEVEVPVGSNNAASFINSDPLVNNMGKSTILVENKQGGLAVFIENGLAAKPGGGPWLASSDKRLKKEVENYNEGLQIVRQIRPVRYRYNGKAGMLTEPHYIGVIAQELQKVAPHMVIPALASENETYLGVDPNAFTYMLINSVQELDKTVQEQQQVIEAQQAKLDAIEKALEKAGILLE